VLSTSSELALDSLSKDNVHNFGFLVMFSCGTLSLEKLVTRTVTRTLARTGFLLTLFESWELFIFL
jgi:hypothetical protein